MPMAAAAITALASQPRACSHGVSVNSPITCRRDAISMIMTMIGTAATPLITALQNKRLDRVERGEIEHRADKGRHRDRAVKRARAAGTLGQPDPPVQRLAHRVGGAAGQHRQCQHSGADDAQCEDGKGEAAGDRAQRLGRLGGGLDVGDAVRVQRRRRRQHDEQGDDVGETHADDRVELHADHLPGACSGASISGLALGSCFSSSTSSAACQKKR